MIALKGSATMINKSHVQLRCTVVIAAEQFRLMADPMFLFASLEVQKFICRLIIRTAR